MGLMPAQFIVSPFFVSLKTRRYIEPGDVNVFPCHAAFGFIARTPHLIQLLPSTRQRLRNELSTTMHRDLHQRSLPREQFIGAWITVQILLLAAD